MSCRVLRGPVAIARGGGASGERENHDMDKGHVLQLRKLADLAKTFCCKEDMDEIFRSA